MVIHGASHKIYYFFPIPFLILLPVLIGIILHFRKRSRFYRFCLVLFGFYLLVLIGLAFFPISIPENWPANLNWADTIHSLSHVNLIPFNYRSALFYRSGLFSAFRDIFLNVLLTIPFGFLMDFLVPLRKKQIIWIVAAAGFTLEGVQLLLKLILGTYFHAVDITDVITNALGALIGLVLYWITKTIAHFIRVHTLRV